MDRQYYVYILSNYKKSVLYTGVTNDLKRRIYEHKHDGGSRFTRQYNANFLVYYEVFDDPYSAIRREKQIKGGSRKKKLALVDSVNPQWDDLSAKI